MPLRGYRGAEQRTALHTAGIFLTEHNSPNSIVAVGRRRRIYYRTTDSDSNYEMRRTHQALRFMCRKQMKIPGDFRQ